MYYVLDNIKLSMANNGILVLFEDVLVLGRYAGRHSIVCYLQLNLKLFNSPSLKKKWV